MIKFCFVFIFSIIFFAGYGQNDTSLVKSQKGYLFISSYNGKYDYEGGHWRPVGFYDYFFPTNSFNKSFLSDSNIAIVFKNGMRVNSLKERHYLKKTAMKFHCSDTSKCYSFNEFYIIPIIITYKIYEDYRPFICDSNSFKLKIINGSEVKFVHQHKAIDVLKYSFK